MTAKVQPLPAAYRPLVLKQAAERPLMPAECHDCAFHPSGSPEQRDHTTWATILANVDRGVPFFCHQGMPMDGDAYKPAVGPDGAPVEGRVCAGWLEMRARFLSVRRADLEDDIHAVASERADLILAVVAATRASLAAHANRAAAPTRRFE